MNASCALTIAVASVAIGGCSSSSHETRDAGPRTDATLDVMVVDTGVDSGSGDASDGYVPPPVPIFTLDAGTTWTALYRDYFGNVAPNMPGCAGEGDCHGSTSSPGYQNTGYLCPKNDKDDCYASLTSQADGGAGLLTPDASFSDDLLSQVLCQTSSNFQGAEMPLYCPYTFTAIDLERIGDWVANGAPND